MNMIIMFHAGNSRHQADECAERIGGLILKVGKDENVDVIRSSHDCYLIEINADSLRMPELISDLEHEGFMD